MGLCRTFRWKSPRQLLEDCDGWDFSPLVRRDWRGLLGNKAQRGIPPALDIPQRLAWQRSLCMVERGDWQLQFMLHEPRLDVSSPDELPAAVQGRLLLRQRIADRLRIEELPLLEFAVSALDWLSDPQHASLRLHRARSADNAAWGSYELGSRHDGSLHIAMRRRSDRVELLEGPQRTAGPEIPEEEFGRLLLSFAEALLREIHERTGWSALALFSGSLAPTEEARPAELPDFDIMAMLLDRPGSRRIAGQEKRLPSPLLLDAAPAVVIDKPGGEGSADNALQLDISLLDFSRAPASPADLQEQLLAGIVVSRGGRELLRYDEGLPLLDFCINCLCWLCRHDSVSLAASRERDPRRRGRPQDFILEYNAAHSIRLGLRDDLRGYLLVLERNGLPVPQHMVALSHSEAWVLLFDIARALVNGVHRRWGWDIRPLFGPHSLRLAERPLQKVESIGYMNLERDVKELSDRRHGVVRGPAGCIRF